MNGYVSYKKSLYLINIHLVGTVLRVWPSIDEISKKTFTGARETRLNNIPSSIVVQSKIRTNK